MPRRILVCVTLLASLGTRSAALGVDYFWQNSTGGAFTEFSNWTPMAPPGPGGSNDTANFDLGVNTSSRYTITDVAGENDQLLVHSDSLELSIFPEYSLLSPGGGNPSFVVGASSGDAANVILSGAPISILETEVTRIGNVAGSSGVVTARGLQWIGNGNFRIGHAGTGTLTIDDDATVSNVNASIGHLLGATGTANVRGVWNTSGDLLIGREGVGDLTAFSGSSITSAEGSIGSASTGEGSVTVDGLDAAWTITNSLTIGGSGAGRLQISTAANVTSTNAYVGRLAGSEGEVVASGGVWTTTGRLSIGGDSGTGLSGGAGTVDIRGGAVLVEQDISLFPDGQVSLDGGRLSAAAVSLQPGGEFEWISGTLQVDEFNGNLSNQGGLLAARENSDTIMINGSYSQEANGALRIEIAGSAVGNQYDSVQISATAFLDGELNFQLNDLYEPSPDEVYTILEGTDLVGSFSNVANGQRIDDTNDVGSFVVHYGMGSPFDPHQVVLTSFEPAGPPGDYNDDGTVDAADYVVWRDNRNTTNTLRNDPIGGLITSRQYDQWQANFGQSAGSGATGLSTTENVAPESATSHLILIVALFANLRRRSAA
jgi:T5SS/PEP-CTERM-associated repeat protein